MVIDLAISYSWFTFIQCIVRVRNKLIILHVFTAPHGFCCPASGPTVLLYPVQTTRPLLPSPKQRLHQHQQGPLSLRGGPGCLYSPGQEVERQSESLQCVCVQSSCRTKLKIRFTVGVLCRPIIHRFDYPFHVYQFREVHFRFIGLH